MRPLCCLCRVSLLALLPACRARGRAAIAADHAASAEACLKLAADPFAGAVPGEWSTPFETIDSSRPSPVCKEAMASILTMPRLSSQQRLPISPVARTTRQSRARSLRRRGQRHGAARARLHLAGAGG